MSVKTNLFLFDEGVETYRKKKIRYLPMNYLLVVSEDRETKL